MAGKKSSTKQEIPVAFSSSSCTENKTIECFYPKQWGNILQCGGNQTELSVLKEQKRIEKSFLFAKLALWHLSTDSPAPPCGPRDLLHCQGHHGPPSFWLYLWEGRKPSLRCCQDGTVG